MSRADSKGFPNQSTCLRYVLAAGQTRRVVSATEVLEKSPRIANEVLQALGVQEGEVCSFYYAGLVY